MRTTEIHYSPYGIPPGGFECKAPREEPYTAIPNNVTCLKCKALSPGLWPEHSNEILKAKLSYLADQLVPVAGLLMQVACSNGRCAKEPEIHEEGCECRVCQAFLTTQAVQNKLEEIIRSLGVPPAIFAGDRSGS